MTHVFTLINSSEVKLFWDPETFMIKKNKNKIIDKFIDMREKWSDKSVKSIKKEQIFIQTTFNHNVCKKTVFIRISVQQITNCNVM